MRGFRLSAKAWKWLICILCASSALLLLIEVGYGFDALASGKQGTLGAALDDNIGLYPESDGTYVLRILQIDPNSPLQPIAKVGDRLRYDRPIDRWRRFQKDEVIGLTVLDQQNHAQHLSVKAVQTEIPFAEKFDYIGRLVLVLPTLLFSIMIGIKQGEHHAQRALALTFCALNWMLYITINYSPAGFTLVLSKLINLTTFPLIWYWCLVFVLHYQPYGESRLRRWLWRALPWYRAAAFATAGYAFWYGLGNEAPGLLVCIGILIATGMTLTGLSLIDGLNRSGGEIRQRHRWLLLSLAAGSIPALLTWIPTLNAGYEGVRWAIMTMFAGQLIMYGGLAYAVLKHRVFNFDFAMSRMAIFSVVSGLLLCTFWLVEQISSSVLHGSGHTDAPPITLGIAFVAYMVFHHLHAGVERQIERVLFHDWHENEGKLRLYIKQAAHFTTVGTLLDSFRTALDRFTAQAGCAIYLKQPDGNYDLATNNSLTGAPQKINIDDTIAVALRSEMARQQIDLPNLPGQLALPMGHRGTLSGFVVIGTKRGGENYRPDECEVMDFATRQIGLDLHALRVEALEGQVMELTHQTEKQGHELQLMAGRRKGPRQPENNMVSVQA